MHDTRKTVELTLEVHEYLLAHSTPLDDVARSLIDVTWERFSEHGTMQISPEQGLFMTMLARMLGARRAIEVGTFTGFSALCIARGLMDDGSLICCDISEEWTSIGRDHWDRAGVGDRIDLRLGPAIETLRALPPEPSFDLAFVDADKPSYCDYFDELVQRLRPGGLLLADNVLWSGVVADPSNDEENTVAIRTFNDKVSADDRVEVVMLPLADGLSLIRKR
jgi:caffeoyl-CoA O-methyltransferase